MIYEERHTAANFTEAATRFTYDMLGHELTRTLPDSTSGSEVESYTYDSIGREATHTDFDGQVETFTYDDTAGSSSSGQIEYVKYYISASALSSSPGSPASETHYTYDSLGRLYTITDDSGTTTNTYDQEGNLTESDTPEGKLFYVYNALDQHTETYTKATSGSTIYTDILYAYDNLGRLKTTRVHVLNGSTLGTDLVTTEYYDANGNKARETLPNGDTTDYTYDALNRLTSLLTKNGSDDLFSQTFTLNPDGSRASVDEKQYNSGGTLTNEQIYTWTYDGLGRLSSEDYTVTLASGSDPRSDVGYTNDDDTFVDLGEHGTADYTDTFLYDLASNRILQGHSYYAVRGVLTFLYDVTLYTYNGDDQLTEQGTFIETDPSTVLVKANYDISDADSTTSFSYDANGSMTDDGTHHYIYDVGNKLVTLKNEAQTSTLATYVYDNAGNRVAETVSGTTTYYLTDKNNPTGYAQPIETRTSATTGSSAETYIIGDHVLGQVASSGSHPENWFLTDGHDSTRALLDYTGVVTSAGFVSYSAFGTVVGGSLPASIFDYAGDAVYDSVSGLYMHGDGIRDNKAGDDNYIQSDDPTYANNSQPITLNLRLLDWADPTNMRDANGHDIIGTLGALAIGGLIDGIVLGVSLGALGAGVGAIDAALGGQNIVQGAIGGFKWGATIGFGIGFLGPFASTFLAPSIISGIVNMGAGASLVLGLWGAEQSYVNGNNAQAIFRIGLSVFAYSSLRSTADAPLKPVNIGGEGEVPNVINLQPQSALGPNYGRATDGRSLAGMIRDGNEFQIYNANTGRLPYPDNSVPGVITNGVPIDTQPGGRFPPITTSEIIRVLRPGSTWTDNGVLKYTKPGG